MLLLLLIASVISFVTTLVFTPIVIRFFRRIGLTVVDIHKIDKRLVVRAGGIAALSGIFAGLMFIIFIQTFINEQPDSVIYMLAATITLTTITIAGFIDDLPTLVDKTGYKEDNNSSIRLKQWQKPLLTIPALVPLMVVSAGTSVIRIPFMGSIDFGILYPLVLVPIGIFGAASMVNNLEGLNGLGSGMGIVYTGMLGVYAYINGRYLAAMIALVAFASLIAFYQFHKTPAQIHAGDSLTYLLGAVIACIAILGNIEKAALICSAPFFIEFALKLRGKLQKGTLGYVDENGKIHSKYDKIYSIPHIFMRTGKFTEKQIVWFMILIELVFASLIWFI